MIEKQYRVPAVSAEQIIEIAEGVYLKGSMNLDEVSKYIKKSRSYVYRIITAAQQLGVIDGDDTDKNFKINPTAVDLPKASGQQKKIVFKKILVKFDPFVQFATFIMKGNTLEDSARKVKVIYNIKDAENDVLQSLRSWGKFTDVIVKGKSGYAIGISEEKLDEIYLQELMNAVQNEFNAKMFIASKVGPDSYAFLSDDEKMLLVNALMKYRNNPTDAIKDAGSAFESFLRRKGKKINIDLSKKNGILELANELKSNAKILEEHRKLSEGLSVFRNCSDHSVQKSTLQHWKVEHDAALESILLFITAIRSYDSFINNASLVL